MSYVESTMSLNDKIRFKPTDKMLYLVNKSIRENPSEKVEEYTLNEFGYLNIRLWEFAKYFGSVMGHEELGLSTGIVDNLFYPQIMLLD